MAPPRRVLWRSRQEEEAPRGQIFSNRQHAFAYAGNASRDVSVAARSFSAAIIKRRHLAGDGATFLRLAAMMLMLFRSAFLGQLFVVIPLGRGDLRPVASEIPDTGRIIRSTRVVC